MRSRPTRRLKRRYAVLTLLLVSLAPTFQGNRRRIEFHES